MLTSSPITALASCLVDLQAVNRCITQQPLKRNEPVSRKGSVLARHPGSIDTPIVFSNWTDTGPCRPVWAHAGSADLRSVPCNADYRTSPLGRHATHLLGCPRRHRAPCDRGACIGPCALMGIALSLCVDSVPQRAEVSCRADPLGGNALGAPQILCGSSARLCTTLVRRFGRCVCIRG